MKTIESTVFNKQAYDILSTTHEPIKINKLGFFISLQEVEQITKNKINTAILKGLEDVREGRVTKSSEEHKNNIFSRIKKEISL